MPNRIERIWIEGCEELDHYTHIAKNLYNEANYILRQEFINNRKRISYYDISKIIREQKSENYYGMPYVLTAEYVLELLGRNWSSFFRSIKEWKKDKSKFHGMPSLPKYKPKDGRMLIIFDKTQVKIVDGELVFPKRVSFLNGIKTTIDNVKLVRILPKQKGYVMEIVYDKPIKDLGLDKSRVAGIDLGVRNIVTLATNTNDTPIIIKGGKIKSMNQYFNKRLGHLKSIYDKQGIKDGEKLRRLRVKREKKMRDYMHKVSREIIRHLIARDIGTLVIGHSKLWKTRVNIGRRNNQNFVGIPFYMLQNMLKYKAEDYNIDVIETEESYTSKCSFFDMEEIGKHENYKGKRNGGLFRTENGTIINADVNGALNIIRKVLPNAFANGIEGAVGHPRSLDF
jgi:putative transposase